MPASRPLRRPLAARYRPGLRDRLVICIESCAQIKGRAPSGGPYIIDLAARFDSIMLPGIALSNSNAVRDGIHF